MRLGGELPLGALPKSGTGPLSKLFTTSIHCRLGSTGQAFIAAERFFSAAHLHQGNTLRPSHAQQIVKKVYSLQAGRYRGHPSLRLSVREGTAGIGPALLSAVGQADAREQAGTTCGSVFRGAEDSLCGNGASQPVCIQGQPCQIGERPIQSPFCRNGPCDIAVGDDPAHTCSGICRDCKFDMHVPVQLASEICPFDAVGQTHDKGTTSAVRDRLTSQGVPV